MTNEQPVSLWQALRPLREDRGLTLRQVAELVGVTEAQISRIERGQTGIPLSTLELYLSAMNAAVVVVDPAIDPRAAMAACTPAQQRLLLRLAVVLPALPEPLFDSLLDQIRAWETRYGGDKS